MSEMAVHSYVDPSDWIDTVLPRHRRTIGIVYDEKPIGPRFPDTDVPVPAEDTPCRDEPDLWFSSGMHSRSYGAEARRICKSCWMLIECRDYGLAHPKVKGIWGGLAQNERQRQQRVAAKYASL